MSGAQLNAESFEIIFGHPNIVGGNSPNDVNVNLSSADVGLFQNSGNNVSNGNSVTITYTPVPAPQLTYRFGGRDFIYNFQDPPVTPPPGAFNRLLVTVTSSRNSPNFIRIRNAMFALGGAPAVALPDCDATGTGQPTDPEGDLNIPFTSDIAGSPWVLTYDFDFYSGARERPRFDFQAFYDAPDLTVTKTAPAGGFNQGTTAQYQITVSNLPARSVTTAPVIVVDTLPSGVTPVSISGQGWNCTTGNVSCTRTDALAGGNSYPPITVVVSLDPTLLGQITNQADVSGGGDITAANNTVQIATLIIPAPNPAAAFITQPVTTQAGTALPDIKVQLSGGLARKSHQQLAKGRTSWHN